jgi:voltage-gated sodium channel
MNDSNGLPRPAREWQGARRLFLDNRIILVAILLNAVVLSLLSFEALRHDIWLEALDYGFTTYFVIEMVLKIRHRGWHSYISVGWNRFDFVVVLLSLPSYAMLIFDIPDLSFLLVLRVARVVKFFRFMRFVPDIENLLAGTRRALRASFFVAVAFFGFNFVVALFSCHLFASVAPEYFANPAVSFYSIFKVFTVEGWYEIPDTISESLSPTFAFLVRLYFMGVVVSGGLFGLSLVNAIFVDEMLRNENDLIEQRLDDLAQKIDLLVAAHTAGGAGTKGPERDDP